MSLSRGFRLPFKLVCNYDYCHFVVKHRQCVVSFHSSVSPLHGKKNHVKTTEFIKRSRPLKDSVNLKRGATNISKPRRYAVLGDVTVDEETYKKMQADDSDQDDIDEEDLENVLQHSDELYSMFKTEEHSHRRFIRNKTLERKIFPHQVEPSLLTWAAREQVRYLHKLDPNEWTAEEIAKHFPISLLGAKKLIRSTFKSASEERIKNYDSSVRITWKKIKNGEIDHLDPSLQERWSNKQLKPTQALPNPALPLPPPRNPNLPALLLGNPQNQVGEFYAIVKPYVDLVKRKEQKNEELVSETNSNSSTELIQKEDKNSRMRSTRVAVTLDDDIGETDRYSNRKRFKKMAHVTHEQFQENMVHGLSNKPIKTDRDQKMLEWLENQNSIESSNSCKPKSLPLLEEKTDILPSKRKFKNEVEVMYSTPKNAKNPEEKEVYLYSASTGYQHPLGKSDNNSERLKIDESIVKEGKLYKKGDSYYSEDGEFLFKVFT